MGGEQQQGGARGVASLDVAVPLATVADGGESGVPLAKAAASSGWVPPFVDQMLRGIGQVVFCNSPLSGFCIFVALCIGDLWLGVLALVGCASATSVARLASFDAGVIGSGLFGYNGTLVGCAFAVFLGMPPSSGSALGASAVGGAASALVARGLGPLVAPVPQWTFAFNLVAIATLAASVRPLAMPAEAPTEAPTEVPMALSELSVLEWFLAALTGVSQIFVLESALAGAVMLAGIAMYSWGCALATLVGSALGLLVAVAFGAGSGEVSAGLWGFNPALATLAVSVFFVPKSISFFTLAIGSAAASAALTVPIKTASGSLLESPSCTVPFCLVASACYLLGGRVPGLVLAADPHSPEANLRAARTVSE